jgi:hypothetical protein
MPRLRTYTLLVQQLHRRRFNIHFILTCIIRRPLVKAILVFQSRTFSKRPSNIRATIYVHETKDF